MNKFRALLDFGEGVQSQCRLGTVHALTQFSDVTVLTQGGETVEVSPKQSDSRASITEDILNCPGQTPGEYTTGNHPTQSSVEG